MTRNMSSNDEADASAAMARGDAAAAAAAVVAAASATADAAGSGALASLSAASSASAGACAASKVQCHVPTPSTAVRSPALLQRAASATDGVAAPAALSLPPAAQPLAGDAATPARHTAYASPMPAHSRLRVHAASFGGETSLPLSPMSLSSSAASAERVVVYAHGPLSVTRNLSVGAEYSPSSTTLPSPAVASSRAFFTPSPRSMSSASGGGLSGGAAATLLRRYERLQGALHESELARLRLEERNAALQQALRQLGVDPDSVAGPAMPPAQDLLSRASTDPAAHDRLNAVATRTRLLDGITHTSMSPPRHNSQVATGDNRSSSPSLNTRNNRGPPRLPSSLFTTVTAVADPVSMSPSRRTRSPTPTQFGATIGGGAVGSGPGYLWNGSANVSPRGKAGTGGLASGSLSPTNLQQRPPSRAFTASPGLPHRTHKHSSSFDWSASAIAAATATACAAPFPAAVAPAPLAHSSSSVSLPSLSASNGYTNATPPSSHPCTPPAPEDEAAAAAAVPAPSSLVALKRSRARRETSMTGMEWSAAAAAAVAAANSAALGKCA